jgi:toxin-antitoxin system PIN domain toxin
VRDLIRALAEGRKPWAIPWPCVYEFLRVVTHPRLFKPPTQLVMALEDLDQLFDSPAITLLGEGPGHRAHLRNMVTTGRATGNIAHDAHIAALLREHAVREFWTTDKDFHRFPGIAVRNPFAADEVHETRVRYGRRAPARRSVR